MSKYIIEIEDEPFVRLSALFGEEGLYRAKGFNSLVFDQFGLDKLTPLDKALSSELGEAYQKGFEAGQHEATTLEYQQGLEEGKKQAKVQAHLEVCHDIERVAHGNYQKGLDDAWETIIKLAHTTYAQRSEIFDGQQDILSIVQKFSPSEVTAKLREYEQQKADEIKVGDEVRNTLGLMDNAVGFVIGITIEGDYNVSRYIDGKFKTGTWRKENCVKTGKHSDAVVQLLAKIKGEQENKCSTCRHDGDSAYCEVCKDYKSWQPKGDDNCDTCKHQNNPNGVRCRNCYDGMYLYQWEPKEGAE